MTAKTDLRIPGLPDDLETLVVRLYERLLQKQSRNTLRTAFYDSKNALQVLGPETGGRIGNIVHPVGWPAKAVDTLNNRCHLEGFVLPGSEDDDLGLNEIYVLNDIQNQAPQASLSSLIHAVSFLVTTRGAAGEPLAIITAKDALSGTGEWNGRIHRLRNFLSLLETDGEGNPLSMALYLPDRLAEMNRETAGSPWVIEIRDHDIGYVPVEPLVYKPRLGREFGSSRISRPVMAYTNSAMRTLLRSEVTAELYSIPQRVIMGADQSMFVDDKGQPTAAWEIIWGKLLGLPADENGNVPKMEQLTQATQEPHMAQLRSLAQMFSGETSIPATELGIHSDSNPASADAVYAHQGSLIATAETATGGWEPAWRKTMLTALKIANGASEIPAEWQGLRARFRNPAYESKAAAADAGLKTVQAFPWIAETDVGLELFFRDETLLERLKNERREIEARTTAGTLAGLSVSGEQANSLGQLIRSGVDPVEAARLVGIGDVRFTGAVPVSLRLPEKEASGLEIK